MSIGFPTDKNTLDQRFASIAWQLRNTLDEAGVIKAWLDTQTDQQLGAVGYSAGDIEIARSSYTDLDNLRKIAHAQGTQAQANDFFFWADKLLGAS